MWKNYRNVKNYGKYDRKKCEKMIMWKIIENMIEKYEKNDRNKCEKL